MLFSTETTESRQRFEEVFGKRKRLKQFITEIVGCDRSATKEAFAHYLEDTNFTADQIQFVTNIIDYLT